MRTVTLAFLAGVSFTGLSAAQAADLDYGVLRGPEYETEAPLIDWSGVYVGAHAGYSSASNDFKNVFRPLVYNETRSSLAETALGASNLLAPRSAHTEGVSFGGIIGYNYQFDDIVIGFEADYTSFGQSLTTADSISRFTTDSSGYLNTVRLSGTARREVEDYGTIRVRAGHAFGSLLPFVTAGLAIGRINAIDQVSVQNYAYDQAVFRSNQALTSGAPALVGNYGYANFNPLNPDASRPAAARIVNNSRNKIMGGIALGAGLEFALTSNIILRAEYQYVMLNDFAANVKVDSDTNAKTTFGGIGMTSINTIRGGAAVKF